MNGKIGGMCAVVVCLAGSSAASANPLYGGRLGLTLAGGGELQQAGLQDQDHADKGGPALDAFVLVPVPRAPSLRVGGLVQFTRDRSVRSTEPIGGPLDGRLDFGKTFGLGGMAEYDLFVEPEANLTAHATMTAGFNVYFPDHEIEAVLEPANEDGLKLGYHVGAGAGIVHMLDPAFGLRGDLTATYEAVKLAHSSRLRLRFHSLRFMVSVGAVFSL